MSPVVHPDGVTFIRDDWKASLPSITPALDFLRSARAPRKIAVFGTISDYPGNARRVYTRVGRAAREAADLVVFVGPFASRALQARRHPSDDAVVAFATVRDASRYLDRVLRPGDLVLLKGSNPADHLFRIALARTRTVGCWRQRCGRLLFCDRCELLDRPVDPETSSGPVSEAEPAVDAVAPGPDAGPPPVAEPAGSGGSGPERKPVAAPAGPVVVGLGNPGRQYVGTPHNVGHEVVDALASALGATWVHEGDAAVARARQDGEPLCLVKLETPVNRTGPALKALGGRLGFGPAECVLVYDDVDPPLGRVRVRMDGSSGGHRGVGSILQEFQTEAFRRVKVGVGRPGGARVSASFLLTPFAAADRPVIDQACQEAARKVLDLLAAAARPAGRGS
jgi:aminoacyl-tRNA hydrolase